MLERCLAKSPGDRFPSFADLLGALQVPWPRPPRPGRCPKIPPWTNYLAPIGRGARPTSSGPPQSGELDLHEFPRGRVLRILRGNIAEQRVDVLVSPMSASSPMRLRRTATHPPGRRATPSPRRRGGSPWSAPAGSIVTSAGRLSARFVFHGVTMGLLGDDWIEPSRDLITEIMSSCFYHADTLIVQSIAFPLLGSGAGGFSREVCLDTIFRYLARTFLHGLTCINDARIVIFPLEWH